MGASVPSWQCRALPSHTSDAFTEARFPVSHGQGFPSPCRDFSLIFSRMLDNLGCPLSLDPSAALSRSPPFIRLGRKEQEPLIKY